ncbi:hypothetical protein MKK75_17955 [Methylobacterium sp. J-030]|uniref:hypothetical protein n=1 Tax=Methylobacterium sp. J-030 TaxID=2836627 RepID=UPI001FB9333E|nr:hypothetical protein [Methylobacterium sp. J-030]MCJ2070652.1 hypothetical protein [Methylobacterium sp. J-030]
MAHTETAGAQLQRLAQALEVPVEAFFGDAPLKSDALEAAELLRLWQAIRDPQNREALLVAARGFVEREADASLAAE